MTASDSARISSSAAIASAFSILAITCAGEPRASISVRRARTSDAERTNESATKSTSSSIANSRSSRSLRVIDGIGSGTPGRLTPLCDETTPPTITLQRARPRSTASTRSLTWPSSISTSLPTWSTEPSTAGLIGRSPSRAASSPAITTVAPRSSVIGSSSSPIRSFGPCRSAISAIGLPAGASASRTRVARMRWSSWLPWDMLSRAPSMPAAIRAASASGDDEAGPIVATIFVRRRCIVRPPPARRAGTHSSRGRPPRSPSWSSIRSSWLYFAVRSERAGAPVLIWPLFVATAMSAIVASSVSPDRCEMIVA